MKISIPCPACAEPGFDVYKILNNLEIRNDELYEFTCINGHNVACVIQDEKFEILFEMGINAIFDGYNREAISCFTASLERYYEYFIKVIAESFNVKSDNFKAAWKKIENSSERQAGAYIFTHLISLKKMPTLLNDKFITLRNKVIHKGYIPSKLESIAYGEEIRSIISNGV